MDKQIPIYFDSVIISSPIQEISGSQPNIGRLKVRVFTKYGNRNGSYITDEVAEQLIESATQGNTPVVGFFDPGTQTWASHTGPTLANGYGYVENFLGWEPFTDDDGITRDYAVFSVILFTDYYDEAKNILGQNQSMELDPESIDGSWAVIGDEEYFVYTRAKMLGFCIIGSHEPCFSVSSFFSKNDAEYKSQYEKFSSLLFDLKARVEEAEKNNKGGEQLMDNFENQEQVSLEEENAPVVEEPQVEEKIEEVEPEVNFEQIVEENAGDSITIEADKVNLEDNASENIGEVSVKVELSDEANELLSNQFEVLQKQLDDLQEAFNKLNEDFSVAQNSIKELTGVNESLNYSLEELKTKNSELEATLATYEAQKVAAEEARKVALVEKYEKIISNSEEIEIIKGQIKDFSYDELESKLAIIYANQQMAGGVEETVPLPEPPESQFALLMKKYRKN